MVVPVAPPGLGSLEVVKPRRAAVVVVAAVCGLLAPPAGARSTHAPRFSHVVEVMLENQSATSTFENAAAAPHLAALRKTGVYFPNFFASGHASLANYEASFAGVEPTVQGKTDCLGQPYATCIFPASVPTLGSLMDAAGAKWRVYSEGMAAAPAGGNCLHSLSRETP